MTVDEIAAAVCTVQCIPKGKLASLISWMIDEWGNNLATIDPVVLDWVSRVLANGGAAPSDATTQAVSTFYKGLVAAGLDTKMISLNVIAPDNLISSITPLIVGPGNDPWTNNNFIAGDLTTSGLAGNAINKYLNTGLNPTTILSGNTEFGFTTYIPVAGAGVYVAMGATDDANHVLEAIITYGGNQCYWDTWNFAGGRITAANAAFAGFISFNRIAAGNLTAVYICPASHVFSTLVSNTTTGGTRPNRSIYAWAINNAGVASSHSANRLCFMAFHHGLTSSESQSLYTLVQALRTSLGGAV